MIPVTKIRSYFSKWNISKAAAKIHCYLTWPCYFLISLLGNKVFNGNLVMFCNCLDCQFRRNFPVSIRSYKIPSNLFCKGNIDWLFTEFGKSNKLGKRTLKFSYVGLDVRSNVFKNIHINIITLYFTFFM